MAHRTLLTGTALTLFLGTGAAFAQDATIYYQTPTVRAGQPIANPQPVINPVPVYTPVPVGAEAGAPVPPDPAMVGDTSYLGTPQQQVSQYNQDVHFVTGGTGAVEKAWFNENQHAYKLKVSYNDDTGHNLAGVVVGLTDSKGQNVLGATTEGPFLLVDAPAGTYTLTSTYEGQTQTKKVTLGKNLTSTGVTFKDINPDQ